MAELSNRNIIDSMKIDSTDFIIVFCKIVFCFQNFLELEINFFLLI